MECDEAFNALNDELISNRVLLTHADFLRQMIVTCDASGYGIDATLGQIDPATNSERPIMFISRLLKKSEINYSTIEKELLSIVWALELQTQNVEHREEVRPENLEVIRDDNNMVIDMEDLHHAYYLLPSLKCRMRSNLEHRIGNLLIPDNLQPYELHDCDGQRSVCHLPAIFRSDEKIKMANVVLQQISMYCRENNYEIVAINFKKAAQTIFRGSNIDVTLYLNKVVQLTDIEDINRVSLGYHRSLLGGHAGLARAHNRIRKYFFWLNRRKDIREYIAKCEICWKCKVNRHTKAPMRIRTLATEPFQHIYIDLVGPINPPSLSQNKYL